MRKLLILVTLLLLLGTNLWATLSEQYKIHLNFLEGLPSRTEGSPEEQKTFHYLTTYAQSLDVPIKIHNLNTLDGYHSYSSIMEVIIPGETDDELVYIFPVSQPPFSNSQRYSASLALGMSLIPILQNQESILTTRLVFMGGDAHKSSEQYLRILQENRVERVYLYLAFDTILPKVLLEMDSTGVTSPLGLTEQVIAGFEQFSIPTTVNITKRHLERLRFRNENSPLAIYLATRSGAIGIQLQESSKRAINLEGIINGLASLATVPLNQERQDRNYLTIPLSDTIITVTERSYLMFVFGTFLLFILIPFVRKRWFHRYVLTIKRHFIAVLLLLIISIAVLFGISILLQWVSSIRAVPNLYQYAPARMLFIKTSLALIVWLLARLLMPKQWKYKASSFYSAVALFILVTLTLIVTLMDITVSIYLIPSLFFMVCAILVRSWIYNLPGPDDNKCYYHFILWNDQWILPTYTLYTGGSFRSSYYPLLWTLLPPPYASRDSKSPQKDLLYYRFLQCGSLLAGKYSYPAIYISFLSSKTDARRGCSNS